MSHSQSLLHLSVNCLRTIVIKDGERYDQEKWNSTIIYIQKILNKTFPK